MDSQGVRPVRQRWLSALTLISLILTLLSGPFPQTTLAASATAGPLPAPADDWSPVVESFKCPTATNWQLYGNAVLTGNGTTDPTCDGWLRLNSVSTGQAGSAVYNVAIPNGDGFVVTFQYADYGGTGADGFSFYLIDGGTVTPTLGAYGGSLGYSSMGGTTPGVTNGYVGIGFDEYGNFSESNFGSGGPGRNAQQIAVRGSGNLLTGFNYLTAFQLDNMTPARTVDGVTRANARWTRVFVVNNKISVQMDFGSGWQTLIDAYDLSTAISQTVLPATFKIGFSGSTGTQTNYHEIRNLTVAKAATLDVNEIADPTAAAPGDTVVFTSIITNDAMNDVLSATVAAPVPARLSNVTWTCSASTGSSCGASGTGAISDTASLLKNGTLTYTIQGEVTRAYGGLIHTTSITPPPAIANLGNGTDSAAVTLEPELAVSGKTTYVGGRPAVVVAPNLVITAGTALTLTGAQVAMMDNFDMVRDHLGISGQGGTSGSIGSISWSYNTTTGVMTLSGTDTISNYQSALRSVTFVYLATPSAITTRTVEFGLGSLSGDVEISVEPDVLAELNVTGEVTYTGNHPPLIVAPDLAITDTNGPAEVLTATRVFIGSNFDATNDRLGISGQSGTSGSIGAISWSYNTSTGVMSLSGTDTIGNYQTALRSVTYYNVGNPAASTTRTVEFMLGNVLAFGGTGHFYEYIMSSGISWTSARTAAAARSYLGKQGYLATILSAEENAFAASKLGGAGAWLGGNDELAENSWRWVTGPETGMLFCTDTVAGAGGCSDGGVYDNWASPMQPDNSGNEDYLQFLAGGSGQWNDLPDAGAGSVQGYVVEYGGLPGDAVVNITGTVNLNVIADTPTELQVSGEVTYTGNHAAVLVAPELVITDTDGPADTLAAARVFIGSNFDAANDRLGILGQSGTSGTTGVITWSYSTTSGIMAITGTASITQYQEFLRTVIYYNAGSPMVPTTRTVEFMLGNVLSFGGTGHFYEYITSASITWSSARAAAVARSYLGLKGYLATLTSAEENAFANSKLGGAAAWLGGSDAVTETYWMWRDGPEAGMVFCIGTNPCVSQNGAYVNWNSGEPNNSSDEDYLQFIAGGTGKWNDLPNSSGSIQGYVVEYGGTAGDPTLHITGTVKLNVLPDTPPELTVSGEVSFTAGYGPVVVAPELTITDTDSPTDTLSAARVVLDFNFDAANDRLGILGQSGVTGTIGALSWKYDTATGVMVLTGTASITYYQEALRTVTYYNLGFPSAVTTRTVEFMLGQALAFPGNGHFYELVSTVGSWDASRTAAAARSYFGRPGYLATITSDAERRFVGDKVSDAHAWLGGAGYASGSEYRWVTGPEGLENSGLGRLFWANACGRGFQGICSATGEYSYWSPSEPNAADATNRVWMGYQVAEYWDDTTSGNIGVVDGGYVVEYGGMGVESPLYITGQVVVHVLTNADLAISKKAEDLNGEPLYNGDLVRYTISVTNTGSLTHTGVVVQDQLPAGVIFVSATPGGYSGPNPLEWSLGSLIPGATWTGEIVVRVDGTTSPLPGNVARISSDQQPQTSTQPILPPGSSDVMSGLLITKQAEDLNGSPLYIGDTVQYTIRITNTGATAMTGVVVTDTLPAGVVFDSATPLGYTGTTTIVWNVGGLAAGASWTGVILVHMDGSTTSLDGNVAQVSSNEQGQHGTDPITPPGSSDLLPGMVVDKTAEDLNGTPLYTGDIVRYTIRVTNTGATTMTGVIVTDTLPAGVTFNSAIPAGYSGTTTVVWNAGALAAGATWTGVILVHVDGTATPIGGNVALVSSNEQGQHGTEPILPPGSPNVTPGLVLAKTAEDVNGQVLYPGDLVRYTIRITNTGTTTMTGVRVTDTLPAGVVFTAATPGGYTGPNPLVWSFASLAAGQSWTAIISVTIAPSVTTIGGNIAQVSSNEQGSQNTDPILPPGGSTVVTNTAPQVQNDLYNVPEGISTTLAVLANDSDWENDPLTVVGGGAAQHGTVSFISTGVIYTPTTGYLGTDTFTYTVSDGLLQSTAQVTATVTPVADLGVSQTIQTTPSGYRIIIVASNAGPRPAPGAVISDTIPANLVGVNWSCAGTGGVTCAITGTGNLLNETFAAFPVGGVVTYTIMASDATGVPVTNTVTITPPTTMFDTNLANNRSSRLTVYRLVLPMVCRNCRP